MSRSRSPLSRWCVAIQRAGLGLAVLACSCQSADTRERLQVISLVQHGKYEEARTLAQALLDEHPEDPVAQRDRLDTDVAWALSEGIRRIYEGRPMSALGWFQRAEELDPENPTSQAWVIKTSIQLAEDALDRGKSLIGIDVMGERAEEYQRALAALPAEGGGQRARAIRKLAESGLIETQLFVDYLGGGSYSAYQDGIRDNEEYIAATFSDLNDDPRVTATEEASAADTQRIVARRLAQGMEYEAAELHQAAWMEFALVAREIPDHALALAALERLAPLVNGAGVPLQRADPVQHEDTLEQSPHADEESARIQPPIDNMDEPAPLVDGSEDAPTPVDDSTQTPEPEPEPEPAPSAELTLRERLARLEIRYQEARAQERAGRFPLAVETYEAILIESENYRDARSRSITLGEFISQAANLYTRALDADSAEDSLRLLREIELFWPGYRDIAERIRAAEDAQESEVPAGSDEVEPPRETGS